MQSCGHNGIWYRVAHAAGIVAERGSLLDAMEAMTKEAIQRLLERLQTGWQPTAEEIDRNVPQRDIVDLDFWKSGRTLIGYPSDEPGWREVNVLWNAVNNLLEVGCSEARVAAIDGIARPPLRRDRFC